MYLQLVFCVMKEQSNNTLSCCSSQSKDRKRQINKHLLVFRLICSLLNPVFSHDALHSVPGVCMFCVAWRGFLSPPGLQLTPLLIGTCPLSISIVTQGKMLLRQQKQKPSTGGYVRVSSQSAQSSVLTRWNCRSSWKMEDFVLTGRQGIRLEIQENTQKWKRKGVAQLSRLLLPVMAPLSAIILPNVLL